MKLNILIIEKCFASKFTCNHHHQLNGTIVLAPVIRKTLKIKCFVVLEKRKEEFESWSYSLPLVFILGENLILEFKEN